MKIYIIIPYVSGDTRTFFLAFMELITRGERSWCKVLTIWWTGKGYHNRSSLNKREEFCSFCGICNHWVKRRRVEVFQSLIFKAVTTCHSCNNILIQLPNMCSFTYFISQTYFTVIRTLDRFFTYYNIHSKIFFVFGLVLIC